jgi:uncharacterized membrane protein YccC
LREAALEDLADQMAGLCAGLAEQDLADAAEKAGALPLLARILTQARADPQPSATIGKHLEELRIALARVGADDLLSPGRRYSPLPGAHPGEYGWICPLRQRCGRVATRPAEHGDAPECAVAGAPMTAVRIKT